jgi:hypothetical protein
VGAAGTRLHHRLQRAGHRHLQGPDGQYLRCRFQLNDPPSGMSGGGQGQCNLGDGRTIDALFPRS